MKYMYLRWSYSQSVTTSYEWGKRKEKFNGVFICVSLSFILTSQAMLEPMFIVVKMK